MDKFILAENPKRPDESGCFVIHMLDPVAIIGTLDGHLVHKQPYRHYSFTNSDGMNEDWTLFVHHLFTTNMNNANDEVADATIDKLLTKAWRWYRAYLDWEENTLDGGHF